MGLFTRFTQINRNFDNRSNLLPMRRLFASDPKPFYDDVLEAEVVDDSAASNPFDDDYFAVPDRK